MSGMFGPILLLVFSGLGAEGANATSGVAIEMPPPPKVHESTSLVSGADAPAVGDIALARYAHARRGPRDVSLPYFRSRTYVGGWTTGWGPTYIGPVWWSPWGWWGGWRSPPCPPCP